MTIFFHITDETNEILQNLNMELSKTFNKLKNSKANLAMKIDLLQKLQEQFTESEKELSDRINIRLDRNDALMKVHKQILEQKTKLERAEREMKTARKSVFQKVNDREFIRLFEVTLLDQFFAVFQCN